MGSLGDEDFLHRVGVVDDDALGGAQLDAEDVAVFLLEKQKADLEVGPHMFSAFAGYRGSKAWQSPLSTGLWLLAYWVPPKTTELTMLRVKLFSIGQTRQADLLLE